MRVYPIGYAAPGAMEGIEELLKDGQTYLVDIRKRAQSRFRPQWNKSALKALFGAQYIHEPRLGNMNYRQVDRHKGIQIADPDEGLPRLVDMLNQGKSVILLCACKNAKTCHRSVVMKLLKAKMPEVEIMQEKEYANEAYQRVG